jgi:hypothetical protein
MKHIEVLCNIQKTSKATSKRNKAIFIPHDDLFDLYIEENQ